MQRFGASYCPRQVEATSREAFMQLCVAELQRAGRVGIRTDWSSGCAPSVDMGHLPFRANLRTVGDALSMWDAEIEPRCLTALICETIPVEDTRCNFVAEGIDDETVFIEFSTAKTTQRAMYDDAACVRRLAIGLRGWTIVHDQVVRCFHPEDARFYRFDIVRDFTLTDPVRALTGTVTTQGRLLFW